jgi:hypothetical protein
MEALCLELCYKIQIAVIEVLLWTNDICIQLLAVQCVDLIICVPDPDSEVVFSSDAWVVDIYENVLFAVDAVVEGPALLVGAVGPAELVVARVQPLLQVLRVEHLV